MRAKRMKSLYVAVSKRPMRLTETEVTPFGKVVRKMKKRADSDVELEMFRASSASAADVHGQQEDSQEEVEVEMEEHEYYSVERESEYQVDSQEECAVEQHQLEEEFESESMTNSRVSWGASNSAAPELPAESSTSGVNANAKLSGRFSPMPLDTFSPVSARRAGGDAGDGTGNDEDEDEGRQDHDYDNDTSETISTVSASGLSVNALERSAERRRSRSASPSAIAAKRASRRESKASRRATSASALLQRSSSGSFLDMLSGKTNYVEEAGLQSVLELLQTNNRLPLVRRLFDNYCKADQTLDIPLVQQLCYDVGVYYSPMDIRIAIKPFVGNSQNIMNYDSFMVWWRSNTDFRYARACIRHYFSTHKFHSEDLFIIDALFPQFTEAQRLQDRSTRRGCGDI
jgi:hypothetical protein